jgi:alpha-L-rhamnosidase
MTILPKPAVKSLLLLLCLALLAPFISISAAPIDDLQRSFMRPPDDARIMMRWWWFGPAVTRAELEREMQLMKEGGIGGFEVQPVYPLVLDDPEKGIKTLPFLSDGFIDALRFTSEKARELGLRFDLTLGSGWPFGGPMVTVDNASGRLRYEHVKIDPGAKFVKQPSIGAGEKLLAAFLARVEGAGFDPRSILELTTIKDGLVALPDHSAGPHEVLFFISSRTGMQVKRPAVGSEGFVLDHMNRAATDMYLKTVGDRLMQAFPTNPPHAVFCDSLEVYGADWSSDFLEEFQRRRGYDLKPQLPGLVNDLGPETKALRRDWGLTLTELLNERFLAPMQQWSKQRRTLFRVQDYGVPAAALSSNAYADLPEGEGAQWKTLSSTRWASSASHIYGRGVTSSETWTWLHSPSFRATPLDMKAEADRHFLVGINQLIGHGWPYTAPGVEYPGWRFYAAAVFDEKNPWWIVMPDIARYLQRVSFMMRQGQPVNDVAIYLPNDDAYASITPGRDVNLRELLVQRVGRDLIPQLLEAGHNFDFFDDDAFKQTGRLDKGALWLGSNRYQIVVLPNVETMRPETYRRFEEFVRGGGTLIATGQSPSKAPGLKASDSDHGLIKETSQRLFASANAPARLVQDVAASFLDTIRKVSTPDVSLSAGARDIGYIHRQTSDAEIYFLANTSNAKQSVKATFRTEGMKAELWDPFTGTVAAASIEKSGQGTAVTLDLEPYASRVLVFSKRSLPATKVNEANASPLTVDLSTDWQVSFGSGSQPGRYGALRSWTDEESTRYFSGAATYTKSVKVSSDMLDPKRKTYLDFGEGEPMAEQPLRSGMQAWFNPPVREAAVVYVNEQRVGSIWCPPFRLDVTGFLRAGDNDFRVVVANTAMNYMAGHSLPDYRLLNLRYGERFQAQDMDKVQPITSGLLGSIRLISR